MGHDYKSFKSRARQFRCHPQDRDLIQRLGNCFIHESCPLFCPLPFCVLLAQNSKTTANQIYARTGWKNRPLNYYLLEAPRAEILNTAELMVSVGIGMVLASNHPAKQVLLTRIRRMTR